MARAMSPVSPNFSLPYSAQNPYHSPFEAQELEISTQVDGTERNMSMGERGNARYADKGAIVEEVERGESPNRHQQAPVYDRLDYWFGGRMDLELDDQLISQQAMSPEKAPRYDFNRRHNRHGPRTIK
ncbi:MAG: hypothetical protein Q9179_000673 [Wetmoreana sp. 5 TL-2023]